MNPPQPQSLTLYSHPQCSLCDKLKASIAPYLKKHQLTIKIINIKQDPSLFKTYRYLIPVIHYNQQPLLQGNPTDAQIQEAFEIFHT